MALSKIPDACGASVGGRTFLILSYLLTHAVSGITIIFIPDKEPKYRIVQLKSGHLASRNPTRHACLYGDHISFSAIPGRRSTSNLSKILLRAGLNGISHVHVFDELS